MSNSAIITGISGMDAAHLAKDLLRRNIKVCGVLRRTSSSNLWRLKEIGILNNPNLQIIYGDVTDSSNIASIVRDIKPKYFFHLAANSFVGCSWDSPSHVIDTNVIGTINCLDAIKKESPITRFYFAASSEMYGDLLRRSEDKHVILNEQSPMIAASPYGVSKVAGYQMTKVYRESYGMFAVCGILFNHCSPYRGEEFFVRKITKGLAEVAAGKKEFVTVGNIRACRDEGHSEDYVAAMRLMLDATSPNDYVIASGESHSCLEWIQKTCDYFGLKYDNVIKEDPNLIRPNEVNVLIGDCTLAKKSLGWIPMYSYDTLHKEMCQFDERRVGK